MNIKSVATKAQQVIILFNAEYMYRCEYKT